MAALSQACMPALSGAGSRGVPGLKARTAESPGAKHRLRYRERVLVGSDTRKIAGAVVLGPGVNLRHVFGCPWGAEGHAPTGAQINGGGRSVRPSTKRAGRGAALEDEHARIIGSEVEFDTHAIKVRQFNFDAPDVAGDCVPRFRLCDSRDGRGDGETSAGKRNRGANES